MKPLLFSFLFILFTLPVDAQMLSSIYFEHNSAELSADSKKTLDSLAQLQASLTFRIFGNANTIGSEQYNQDLSVKRAVIVQTYLSGKIRPNINIKSAVGLGETKQINDNSTEELAAKNRRVDVFIERAFLPNEKISRKSYPRFIYKKAAELKVGDTFSLPNVNFIGGRHVWLPEAFISLAQLYKTLHENPSMKVELQGHICCDYENFDGKDVDTGTYNLSYNRALAIKNYLQKEGIDSSRVKIKGLGHLNPLVYPERTNEDRTKNRRVEVVLLEK